VSPRTDVYSFGILVNELLTETLPYDKVLTPDKYTLEELIKTVLGGEEEGINRPRLIKNPTDLREMIKSCWVSDPLSRPTFPELDKQKAWEKASKANSTSATDATALALLKVFDDSPGPDKSVLFTTFLDVLKKQFNLTLNDPRDVTYRNFVCIMDIGNPSTDKVTYEKVERFNLWFSEIHKKDIVHTIDALCSKPWFWGPAEEKDASEVLAKHSTGTYIVRWSNTYKEFYLTYVFRGKKAPKVSKSEKLGRINVTTLFSVVTQKMKDLRLKNAATPRPVIFGGLNLESNGYYLSSPYEYSPKDVENDDEDVTSHGPVNFIP